MSFVNGNLFSLLEQLFYPEKKYLSITCIIVKKNYNEKAGKLIVTTIDFYTCFTNSVMFVNTRVTVCSHTFILF